MKKCSGQLKECLSITKEGHEHVSVCQVDERDLGQPLHVVQLVDQLPPQLPASAKLIHLNMVIRISAVNSPYLK